MMKINLVNNKAHIFNNNNKRSKSFLEYALIFICLYQVGHGWPPLREIIVTEAARYIDKPYLAHPLGTKNDEVLVAREDSFDCVTFIETIMSHALATVAGRPDQSDSFLIKLRYRDGRIQGYESRIHYFSEWLFQAEKNGYGKNISESLRGTTRQKKINFMSEHPALYPKLNKENSIFAIRASENTLSKRPTYYIPKQSIKFVENQLLPGDILAFTTHKAGLDIIHTAIVFKVTSHAYMIHASSKECKVEVSKQSVSQWINQNKSCDGMIVFRPEYGLSG